MLRIGLTGGIATGKSTAAEILAQRGLPVIDADQVAHEVTEAGSDAAKEIAARLGPEFLRADGSVDRPHLARHVFQDPEKLRVLNAIVHPRVRQEIERRCEALDQGGSEVAILDIPLLLEAGDRYAVDEIWLVYAPERMQIARLMERNGLSEGEALARIRAQMPIEEKRRRADVVIENTGDVAELRRKVEAQYRRLLGR